MITTGAQLCKGKKKEAAREIRYKGHICTATMAEGKGRVEKIGDLTVYVVGEQDKQEEKENIKKKEVLITFHDVGMNHKTCFAKFLEHEDITCLHDRFVIYHIDAPGQESDADSLIPDYQYPSIKKLADLVGDVIDHFSLEEVICLGVGAGANVLAHLAMSKWADKILGLALVEPAISSASFAEWGETKMKTWQLDHKGFTESTANYLMWHHFDRKTGKADPALVNKFVEDLKENMNPHNVAEFIKCFQQRPDLLKEVKAKKIKSFVMVVSGDHSRHKEHAESLYHVLSPLDPKKYSILHPDCGASVLEEKPQTMAEGLLLFIQGCGLVPTLRTRAMSRSSSVGSSGGTRTLSMSED